MESPANRLPQLYSPTETDYVAAVRADILNLSRHHTQKEIAQRVGVHPRTIHNAQEGKTALEGWVIPRLEWEFGPEATKNIRALGGGNRNRDPEVMDALRPHVEAIHNILAEATESMLAREASRGRKEAA
jgi:hypothetical protein